MRFLKASLAFVVAFTISNCRSRKDSQSRSQGVISASVNEIRGGTLRLDYLEDGDELVFTKPITGTLPITKRPGYIDSFIANRYGFPHFSYASDTKVIFASEGGSYRDGDDVVFESTAFERYFVKRSVQDLSILDSTLYISVMNPDKTTVTKEFAMYLMHINGISTLSESGISPEMEDYNRQRQLLLLYSIGIYVYEPAE